MFRQVKFKYIGIEDGSFLNMDSIGAQEHYATKKVNVNIYNLSYHPSKQNSLQTDSIKLNLNKIKFLSKDGKSQLTVDELAIAQNVVILKNAEYALIHPKGKNSLNFKTPSLLLKKVDLSALLNKRIYAEEAELLNPVITVLSSPKLTTVKVVDTVADFSKVFSLFRNIKGLIAVKQFKIKDGSFHLSSHAKFNTNVKITKLNSRILVDKLLNSDTTLEIKYAIPEISFKQMKLTSSKLKFTLNDYFFNGLLRHNSASSVDVNLANGTKINGKKVYWEWLDWDLYQSYKLIYIDSLKAGALAITLGNSAKQNAPHKPLPKIHIGRLDIASFKLSEINSMKNIQVQGKNIFAQQLKSAGKSFVWDNFGGDFNNLNYRTEKLSIKARSIKLNARSVNKFEGIVVKESNNQGINMPLIEVKGPFLSSYLKTVKLDFVHVIDPKISLKPQESREAKEKKLFNFPIDFEIRNLVVKNGKIDVQKIKANDTTKIIADLNLNLKNATGHKLGKELIAFEDAKISVNQLNFIKPRINLSAPFNLELSNTVLNKVNNRLELSTAIEFGSNKMNLNFLKDSTHFTVNDASIRSKDNKFKQGMPLAWERFLYKTDLNIYGINYQNKSSTIKVDNIKWLPENKRATLTGFDFRPNLSWEETRLIHPLQADYIAANARNIELDGVGVSRMVKKEKLDIQRVLIDGAELSASRDKRMPDGSQKEKLMPSKLIANVKFPFKVIELALKTSHVNIHEISKATSKEGIIRLENVNVKVLNLTNQFKDLDSLIVNGNVDLLGKSKVSLNYRESYLDSLSGFKMNLAIVPMDLTNFSQISIPMAAVRVNSGNTETLFVNWSGNKYLADGEFYSPTGI
ncbi:hypothetical protein EZ449_21410 [Pedobacter frigidisoli]|uniref:AsmA-like C-terminal region n=1 Tax=Pedobacter frigidisoli TaxID=2530455 RepID=A0A4R0NH60_9SPHI|nr:hypothetical protein [Pedobacter frigidisoli]TCC99087.1 hypothetical protein EZ449_21410 [Pedobacter frigidisoli]